LQPGWQAERRANFHRGANEAFRGEKDLICDIWTEVNRNHSAEQEEQGWPSLDKEELAARYQEMDFRVMERLRRRVDDLVDNPETARLLKPWYRYQCKRPTSNDEYYQTFNRPNVKLIDVSRDAGRGAADGKGLYRRRRGA
jgi:cation diffusion facilitator CzcD-associated flavoprotein CzcO